MLHTYKKQHGFTLIELLVVIAIVAGLLGIGMGVGAMLTGVFDRKLTLATLKLLDSVNAEYKTLTGDSVDPIANTTSIHKDIKDNSENLDKSITNNYSDIRIYTSKTLNQSDLKKIYGSVDDKLQISVQLNSGAPKYLLIRDPWDAPVRYIHPKQDKILRRYFPKYDPDNPNIANFDPYFASAGPDGKFGDYQALVKKNKGDTLNESAQKLADQAEDNIYSFDVE